MKKFSSTMRGNSRRTSQNKKRIFTTLVVGAFVLVLIFLVPRLLAGIVGVVVAPVHVTKTWFTESSAGLPQYIRDRATLAEEILALKEQVVTQKSSDYTLQVLQKENEMLRQLLGNAEQEKILAGIIGRPNELPYDVLVVDRGTADGVVENAPVFLGDNAVIGIVKKAFLHSSVVELITTPGFVASVYIVGPDIYTNAVGVGGGQLRVGVPQGITLTEGDVVILPSVYAGIYGEINYIDSVPSRPEQYGYVSPEIPIASMRLVGIGVSPVSPVTFEEAQQIVTETKNSLFEVPIPDDILVSTEEEAATSTATSTENQDAI